MPIKTIDSGILKRWLDKNEVVLIDVREPEEYALENISAAKLIPLNTISTSKLPDIQGKKIVIHCRSGKRSLAACEKLLSEDNTLELYNLDGGILSWGNFCKRSS